MGVQFCKWTGKRRGIYCKLTGKKEQEHRFAPAAFDSVEGEDMCPGSYALGIILASKDLTNLCRDVSNRHLLVFVMIYTTIMCHRIAVINLIRPFYITCHSKACVMN